MGIYVGYLKYRKYKNAYYSLTHIMFCGPKPVCVLHSNLKINFSKFVEIQKRYLKDFFIINHALYLRQDRHIIYISIYCINT